MRAGWFPAGGGRIEAKVAGTGRDALLPVDVRERGPLVRVDGTVPLLRLPVRIGHRLADRALAGLAGLDVPVVVDVAALEETSAGVGLFLAARYDGVTAGFSAIGARGKPAEAVADEAVRALLDHHAVGAALDVHQSGQCLLSMALAPGPSRFSVARLSRHFETNRAVIERFGIAHVTIDERPGGGHDVRGEGGLDADQHRREAAARAFSKRGGGA
jgi:RNA 3'-terminal phosphate cyclase (ATP)